MKNLGLATLFAVLATALIQIGIVVVYGWPTIPWPVEVLTHPRVSFAEEARRAIFYSSSLAKSKQPMVVIAGGSAAQEGYQPEIVRVVAPNLLIHNLSMGGANITAVDQIIDHVLKAAPSSEIMGHSLLVLSITYPMFIPDQRRWRDPKFVPADAIKQDIVLTDIEREAMRCPSVCNPGSRFFKIAPGWLVALAKERYTLFLPIIRHLPVHPGDPLLSRKVWRQDPRKFLEPKSPKKPAPEAPIAPPEPYLVMAHKQMDYLTQAMHGSLHDEQFEKLKTLINKIQAYGFRVVVVDMPLPSWHREKSPFFALYQTKLRTALASQLDNKQAEFVSLTEAIPDDEFRDSVHPKAEATTHWARVLMERL